MFISGEEFDFDGQAGVHSLGILQRFNLPKVNRIQQEIYKSQAVLSQKQLDLTKHELSYQISLSYIDLIFQKQKYALAQSLIDAYQELSTMSEEKFRVGEIGKLSVITAQEQVKIATWKKELWEQDQQLALIKFNSWLQSDTDFDTDINALPPPSDIQKQDITKHPLVQYYQQTQQVANAKVGATKSQSLPQLQTGLQLQTVNGKFLFYGYQLGVNVQLFKKSQNTKIEAAELQVQISQAQSEALAQHLTIKGHQLRAELQNQLESLRYLEEEILPSIKERQGFAMASFREGQASYLEYIQSTEQYFKYQLAFVETLKEFHLSQMELKYLLF